MGSPRPALLGCFVQDDTSAQGCQGCSIEVERAVEMGFGRQARIEAGGPKKIESSGGLREKMAPQVEGELFVGSTKDGDKMVLERLDGTFSGISAVTVWGDELEVDAFLTKIAFVGSRGFIVKALVTRGESAVHKVLVEEVERSDVFQLGTVLQGGGEDCIAIINVAHQDVFVAAAGGDWEVAG